MKDRQIRYKMYKNNDDQSPFEAQVALSLKYYYTYIGEITLNAWKRMILRFHPRRRMQKNDETTKTPRYRNTWSCYLFSISKAIATIVIVALAL